MNRNIPSAHARQRVEFGGRRGPRGDRLAIRKLVRYLADPDNLVFVVTVTGGLLCWWLAR
jgi:hypothetical protein